MSEVRLPEAKEQAARVAPLAVVSMVLGIVGMITAIWLYGAILGVVAIVLGSIEGHAIEKHPDRLAGKGFAKVGKITGICSVILMAATAVLLPGCGGGHRELANRAACAANITETIKHSMVWANCNSMVTDGFPITGYPAKVGSYSAAMGVVSTATDPDTALEQELKTGETAGNPVANLWTLVLTNHITPKNLICKSDPAASSTPSPVTDESGHYYLTPASGNQISYSIAYPYASTSSVGQWWMNYQVSDLPVMSDMGPLEGTGNPVRTLTAGKVSDDKVWNSFNHNGAGQNVGYADAHCEWRTNPLCGQGGDNIFTTGKGAGQRAGTAGSVGVIGTKEPPFDTIMVPVRDGARLEVR